MRKYKDSRREQMSRMLSKTLIYGWDCSEGGVVTKYRRLGEIRSNDLIKRIS